MEGYSQDPNARIAESRRQVGFQKQTSNIFDLLFSTNFKRNYCSVVSSWIFIKLTWKYIF